ncbi:hypothetical protein Celaphus_00018724 [Cervus elaphus hippelaphus]|uniref:Uncharacterized protein n=1 Tax=Cervus elaphus hippelaphus TaxID=46360 RepID=A0A212C5P8_CEREH|nr:hypothetical protein Celaphus_00018724 [Cervus elaphus hippelaphus]
MLQAGQKLRPTPAAGSASRLSDQMTRRKEEPEAPVGRRMWWCSGSHSNMAAGSCENTAAVICCDTLYLCSSAEHHGRSQGQWSSVSWTSPLSKGDLGKRRASAPSIYFAAYSNCKEKLNGLFDIDSTQVHMISAAMTGIYCIFLPEKRTVIHFAIYENIKQKLLEYKTASTMENEEESIKKCRILHYLCLFKKVALVSLPWSDNSSGETDSKHSHYDGHL